ncbi:MAG: ABC transporter ATP-binding protein [Lachnospiraceae bacterium]|nr:ABC transporter ATP-binding protein [Lachnospiraceae bacterium]
MSITMLEVQGLHKKYQNTVAVDDVSFKIDKQDIFGLLGPNGAGKSTTISIISGIIHRDKGEILVEGKNFDKNLKDIKRNMGLVPQDIIIFEDLTAKENLEYFGSLYGINNKTRKHNVDQTLEFIGLTDVANKFPKTFSGGMKRRLNIGCAIVHRPQIIILDEPTVGIDAQSRNHIMESIRKLNQQGATIIYTSHYMEEIQSLCNRLLIIDKGKVVESGNTNELLLKYNLNETYLIMLDKKIQNELCKQLNEIIGVVKCSINEKVLEIEAQANTFSLKHILDVIERTNYKFLSINMKRNNLEDIFLHLTGKTLRD